jgi:hypothetical protein
VIDIIGSGDDESDGGGDGSDVAGKRKRDGKIEEERPAGIPNKKKPRGEWNCGRMGSPRYEEESSEDRVVVRKRSRGGGDTEDAQRRKKGKKVKLEEED